MHTGILPSSVASTKCASVFLELSKLLGIGSFDEVRFITISRWNFNGLYATSGFYWLTQWSSIWNSLSSIQSSPLILKMIKEIVCKMRSNDMKRGVAITPKRSFQQIWLNLHCVGTLDEVSKPIYWFHHFSPSVCPKITATKLHDWFPSYSVRQT
jgi:hypothetical protein